MLLYLANTNRWFHNRLWNPHEDEDDLVWVDDIHDAELVIFPFPEWRDPAAPFNFRRLPVSILSRVYTFSANDVPLVWAPGVYTSLPRSRADAAFRGGFYIRTSEGPQGMGNRLEPRGSRSDRYLWSFLGTVENYPRLRTEFFQLSDDRGQCIDSTPWLSGRTVPGTHTPGPISRRRFHETFDDYADSIQNSKFVLCPRGKGPSSIRLFEAMQAARCPVIVSDEWLPPDDVDWSRCSIRLPESDVHQIPRLLREREDEAAALGAMARKVWLEQFAPSRRLVTLARSCIDIHRQTSPRRRIPIALRAAVTRQAVRHVRSGFEHDVLRRPIPPPPI